MAMYRNSDGTRTVVSNNGKTVTNYDRNGKISSSTNQCGSYTYKSTYSNGNRTSFSYKKTK